MLERPLAGIGLRFNSPRPLVNPEETFDFKIEPWFRDPNLRYLFIEIRSEFLRPINNLELVERRVEQTYDYLVNKISRFIAEPSKLI